MVGSFACKCVTCSHIKVCKDKNEYIEDYIYISDKYKSGIELKCDNYSHKNSVEVDSCNWYHDRIKNSSTLDKIEQRNKINKLKENNNGR